MEAALYDLSFSQGDGFTLPLTIKAAGIAMDLTGYTGLAQIRKRAGAPVLATFAIGIPDQSILANRGKVTLSLTGAQSAALPAACAYDFELVPLGSDPQTYLYGDIKVRAQVSTP